MRFVLVHFGMLMLLISACSSKSAEKSGKVKNDGEEDITELVKTKCSGVADSLLYTVICVFCEFISVDTCGPMYRWLISKNLKEDVPQKTTPQNVISATANLPVSLSVNTSHALHTVDHRFLSVALDAHNIRDKWQGFDFNSTRFKTLARALSPSFLRVSGTDADYLLFNDSHIPSHPTITSTPDIRINRTRKKGIRDKDRQKGAKKKRIDNFIMTATDWDSINQFATDVGWQIIFDLNMLLRNGTRWDPTNAELLLQYTREKGYNISGWELGNEPNQLDEMSNILVSPEQLAQDFLVLRETLDRYGFHNSFLVGPDVTNPSPGSTAIDFLKRFLCSCGNSTLATTWHSYSMDGKNASVEKFTNPDIMDSLKTEIDEVAKDIEVFRPHLTKSWIGETAGAYGGGAPGLSNTYVGGFLWLDKLGLAAMNNVDLVIRQTFFGGHYGLLDKDSNPTPMFWLSVLYKQLVGPIVLKATSTSPNVRAYAHCINNQTSYYNTGYVTIFVINLHPGNHLLITFTGELAGKNVIEYRLTADDKKNITDTKIDLNDKLLRLTDNDRLPLMKGKELSPYKPITLPPLSYGFFVIDANATACYQ